MDAPAQRTAISQFAWNAADDMLHPGATPEQREIVADALSRYPEGVIADLRDKGLRIKILPPDADLRDHSPALMEQGEAFPDAGGIYVWKERTILLKRVDVPCVVHETAHAFDNLVSYHAKTNSWYYDSLSDWAPQIRAAWIDKVPISPYASETNRVHEFMAEAIRAFVNVPDDKYLPHADTNAFLKETAPEVHGLIQRFFDGKQRDYERDQARSATMKTPSMAVKAIGAATFAALLTQANAQAAQPTYQTAQSAQTQQTARAAELQAYQRATHAASRVSLDRLPAFGSRDHIIGVWDMNKNNVSQAKIVVPYRQGYVGIPDPDNLTRPQLASEIADWASRLQPINVIDVSKLVEQKSDAYQQEVQATNDDANNAERDNLNTIAQNGGSLIQQAAGIFGAELQRHAGQALNDHDRPDNEHAYTDADILSATDEYMDEPALLCHELDPRRSVTAWRNFITDRQAQIEQAQDAQQQEKVLQRQPRSLMEL